MINIKINIKKMKIQYLHQQIIESKRIISKVQRDLDSLLKDEEANPEKDFLYWKLHREIDLEREILDFHNQLFDNLITELTE